MEDEVDAVDGPPAGVGIAEIALQQFETAAEGSEVFPLPREKIIQDADLLPPVEKRLDRWEPMNPAPPVTR